MTRSVVASSDPYQGLVQHDLVEDVEAAGGQPVGEPPCQRAASFDEVGDPVAAELAQRRPGREPAGASRRGKGQVRPGRRPDPGPGQVGRRVGRGRGVASGWAQKAYAAS